MGSFQIDVSGMMQMASQIFNGLGPIFFVIIGVTVGFGLLMRIANEFRRIF